MMSLYIGESFELCFGLYCCVCYCNKSSK